MQSTPPQQIQKPNSTFRRKKGSDLANISHSKINNKQNKLKHQRIIEISYLQPEKQIQITRKSRSNQQGDGNTVRK